MILPVIALPPPCSDGLDVDTLTSRLAALAEVVLHGSGYPPAGGGSGAEVAASYKPFLRECGCRVGPFEVFSGDRDAQVYFWQVFPLYAAVALSSNASHQPI